MARSGLLTFFRRYKFETISFIVGAVELTLELTASRIAAPYIGLTIYVWTSVIGVILAALAVGYLLGGRLADKRKNPFDVVFLLVSAAILIGLLNTVKDPLLGGISHWTWLPSQLQALLVGCLLFAGPTIVLGMVTPYLARLSVVDVATSGRHVSRINAAGTFGSLFGTFFTGFFLFTLVGTRNILMLLGFVLIATSCMISLARRSSMRWWLTLLAVLILLLPSKLHASGVVKDFDTAYNRYVIREDSQIRVLQGDKFSWESGINKDSSKGPLFAYIRAFAAASMLPDTHKNYLIIGGGAYTLPTLLTNAEPNASVDVVEIDKALQPISEQYFNFKPAPNIHIYNQDGRQYLNNSHKKYDMIYLDAFSNATPPFQLLTQQTDQRLRRLLKPGGMVAVNMVTRTTGPGEVFLSSAMQTYGRLFSDVRAFRVTPAAPSDVQNVLLLMRTAPFQAALDKLAAQNPEFRAVLAREITEASNTGMVLTDDFAPVEQMAAWQN